MSRAMTHLKPVYSQSQVQHLLGVSRQHIIQLLREGELTRVDLPADATPLFDPDLIDAIVSGERMLKPRRTTGRPRKHLPTTAD
jgi:hypothetical protein